MYTTNTTTSSTSDIRWAYGGSGGTDAYINWTADHVVQSELSELKNRIVALEYEIENQKKIIDGIRDWALDKDLDKYFDSLFGQPKEGE